MREPNCFRRARLLWLIVGSSLGTFVFAQAVPLYENNFEKAEVGKVPEDMLVLDGNFAVKDVDGNRVLELPGAPLDSYAVLFGPTETSEVMVTARVNSVGKGRRFPTFGVGLNGVAGYKLQISPAKKLLELYKDQEVKASAEYDWTSGRWTQFKLQVRKSGEGEWAIEGKAWPQGSAEPEKWIITITEKEEPVSGRASVFGSPFSGTPIQFDDLAVKSAEKN